MKKYTVILLWPDYTTDSFGQDTYMTSVEAADPEGAVVSACDEAIAADNDAVDRDIKADGNRISDPSDLFVIAVIEGEHQDIKP